MSDTCILAEEAMDEINNDGVSFESGVTSTRTIYEKEDVCTVSLCLRRCLLIRRA